MIACYNILCESGINSQSTVFCFLWVENVVAYNDLMTVESLPVGVMTLTSLKWSEVKVAQSCLTLCNPMDFSVPGSSAHGILQAIILEWVAIAFSRGSSQPRDWTQVSLIAGVFFTIWATRETHIFKKRFLKKRVSGICRFEDVWNKIVNRK